MSALIIGGGNAAKTLVNYFIETENLKIEAVIDLNENAPGMVYAREKNIPTSNQIENYIESPEVDIIVELTGNRKVRESILSMKKPHQEIMTAGAARILSETLENVLQNNASTAVEVSKEFSSLTAHMNSVIDNINKSIMDVAKVNNSLHLTSPNATVEAARLGSEGRSFSVITDEMKKLSDNINEVLAGIQDASSQLRDALEKITKAENRLKSIFNESEKNR
jgi:methyl-accepting chemotaxis protein